MRTLAFMMIAAGCGSSGLSGGADAPAGGMLDAPAVPDARPLADAPPCGNGTLDPGEACDSGDGCSATCGLEINGGDYDVAGDGSVFAAWVEGTTVKARCFAPGGAARGPAFEIEAGAMSPYGAAVSTARTAGSTLVTWRVQPTNETIAVRARVYDASCQPLGAAFAAPPPAAGNLQLDQAIDASGRFALFWATVGDQKPPAWLSFYSAAGVKAGADLQVDDGSNCSIPYSMHVGLAASGAGVVSCQQHQDHPVMYRRFDAGHAFLDAAMVPIADSADNHSSWYQSSDLGVTDDGHFAIEWQDATNRTYRAAFFDAAGKLLASVQLGSITDEYYWDGFTNARTLAVQSGNYLFRSNAKTPEVWAYSPAGALVGCTSTTDSAAKIRGGGATAEIVDASGSVRPDLDLSGFRGCAPPTCGNGHLDPFEECDDGNLAPYDGCDEQCRIERCGDGEVSGTETCDDGNTKAGDGCDASCQLEAPAPLAGDTYTDVLDVDVTTAGDVALLGLDTRSRLTVSCYGPDRRPRRAAFPVSLPAASARPTIRSARTGARTAVIWQSDGGIRASLLDGSCLILRANLQALSVGSEFADVAVDDAGRFVVASTDENSALRVAFFDAQGARVGTEQTMTRPSAPWGVHVAMNPTTGAGIVSVQGHSGDVVSYRRFSAAFAWLDDDLVPMPADVYWYDGHTVGMNDAGQFVFEWRSEADGNPMKAAFYGADGKAGATVTFSTRVRATGYQWDNFRQPHEAIALSGANFVLGEAQNGGTGADLIQSYFVYTPAGTLVKSFDDTVGMNGGLGLRLGEPGRLYFLDGDTVRAGNGP